MNKYQRQCRAQLHKDLAQCWGSGRIAISGKHIGVETFISEVDQVAQAHHIHVDIKRMGGKAYAMANYGLPLGLDPESDAGKLYKRVNPQYRINQAVWGRITEGLGLD